MSGADTERELVNHLDDQEIPAIRIPASGSGGQKDLPDILFKLDVLLVGAEVKYTSEDRIYVQAEEVEALERFCKTWSARPVVIVRFSYDTTFYVLSLSEDNAPYRTRSENLSISREKRSRLYELDRYLRFMKRAIQ